MLIERKPIERTGRLESYGWNKSAVALYSEVRVFGVERMPELDALNSQVRNLTAVQEHEPGARNELSRGHRDP